MRHGLPSSATLLILALTACGGPTAPSAVELEQDRATWANHNLTRYAYDYEETGFFNNLAGQVVHLVVLGDTINSATVVATGAAVPLPDSRLTTIDGLFARAMAARDAGILTDLELDPVFNYPRRIELSGPPDASGAITAFNLQPLP